MSDDVWGIILAAFAVGVVVSVLYIIFIVFWYISLPVVAVGTGGVCWWKLSGRFSYERKRAEILLWLRHRWIEVKTWFKGRH